MDAIQLLKQEHEKAKKAFAQIQSASAEQRSQLWKKLAPELKVHEQMEETALYRPVAQEAGSNDETLREWPQHHHEEVAEAEALIKELSALDATDDEWMEKLDELQGALEHHIEQEEGAVWPRIQQVWDRAKLEQAAQQMETIKREKMQQAA